MNYFTDFCFLCLGLHNNLHNVMYQCNDGLTVQEKLRTFLPDYLFLEFNIPKHVCVTCIDNISNIYKYRERCFENITILNEYIQSIIKRNGVCYPVNLTDLLHYKQLLQAPRYNGIENINIDENAPKIKSEKTDPTPAQSQEKNLEPVMIKVENIDEEPVENNDHFMCDNQFMFNEENDDENDSQQKEINVEVILKEENSDNNLFEQSLIETNEVYLNEDQNDEYIPENDLNDYGSDSTDTEDPPENLRPPKLGYPRYHCSFCSKSFPYKSALRIHNRSHNGERPYECEVCHKRFTMAGHLNQHKFTHITERSHRCEICHKSFTAPIYLDRHKRIHSKERPFRCEVCDKTFRCQQIMKKHVLTHSGEKPFQCELCSYRCVRSGHLKDHMKRHTGEKPYKCEHCNQNFAYISNLYVHLRTKHNVKVEKNNSPTKVPCEVTTSNVKIEKNNSPRKVSCEVTTSNVKI